MGLQDFAKSEWQEIRADAKYDIYKYLLGLFLAGMLAAAVWVIHRLSWLPWWALPTAVFLLAFLGFTWTVRKIGTSPGKQRTELSSAQPLSAGSSPAAQGAVTLSSLVGQPNPPNFDAITFFKYAYHSPMTAEVEKNIHIIAEQNSPNDQAGWLCRFVGVGLVAAVHQHTWENIFRSQILMLEDLNRKKMMPLSDARVFYDKASQENPSLYSHYSITQWTEFMVGCQLLVMHPSQMLEISWMGQDFLKYVAHFSLDAAAKRN